MKYMEEIVDVEEYIEADIRFHKDSEREKARTRRDNEAKYKTLLKGLEKVPGYPTLVMKVDKMYIGTSYKYYIELEKPYYKKCSSSCRGKNSKYYKKIANKKTRKYKHMIPKGSSYKKCSEYWWNIT